MMKRLVSLAIGIATCLTLAIPASAATSDAGQSDPPVDFETPITESAYYR